MIVTRICVSFKLFCKWMWASKLSDTTWIRPSDNCSSSSLSSLSTAADILCLLTFWCVDVIPYLCKCSINILSWAKIPRADYNWVNNFVKTGVTIAKEVLINKAKSAATLIRKIFCNDSVLFCFSFCHFFDFFFYSVCITLHWNIIINIIVIFRDNFKDWGHFFCCPLTTNVPHLIETSQLICIANQLTGFYMMGNIDR